MSESWVALINLPHEREESLTAILVALGVRVHRIRARATSVSTSSADLEAAPPALIFLPVEEYDRCRAVLRGFAVQGSRAAAVLLTPSVLTAEGLRTQMHYDVLNVIPDALWDDPGCLANTVRGLVFPHEMFDIRRFLPDAAVVERFTIASLVQKQQVAEEVMALAKPFAVAQNRLRDLGLIIIELINNAFFHSFRDGGGEAKYSPPFFSGLEDEESVLLEVAMNDAAIALAVEDNRGTLDPHEVLKYLRRQTSGAGIYDSHGRGFYLISSIADHLSVCLTPGQKARVVAVNHGGAGPRIGSLNFFVSP